MSMPISLKRKASLAFKSDPDVFPEDTNKALFETGKFSDLTIECKDWRFKAHKSVICVQSAFFERACEGGFKVCQSPRSLGHSTKEIQESVENVIRFPEEEPITVHRVMEYFYLGDFDSQDEGYNSIASKSSTEEVDRR